MLLFLVINNHNESDKTWHEKLNSYVNDTNKEVLKIVSICLSLN